MLRCIAIVLLGVTLAACDSQPSPEFMSTANAAVTNRGVATLQGIFDASLTFVSDSVVLSDSTVFDWRGAVTIVGGPIEHALVNCYIGSTQGGQVWEIIADDTSGNHCSVVEFQDSMRVDFFTPNPNRIGLVTALFVNAN